MARQTIGGHRLGAGGKMTVEGTHFNRSSFNISKLWRSTMSMGTLVPFLCEPMLPGDSFSIDLDAFVNTMPTIGPAFASAKLQMDIFQIPIRLYQRMLHNNELGIGLKMNTVKLPQIELSAWGQESALDFTKPLDNQQINPSALLSYLNIRGIGNGGINGAKRQFNALALLGYWDIYKNYYANRSEQVGVYITSEITINKTITQAWVYKIDGTQISLPQEGAAAINEPLRVGDSIIFAYTGAQPNFDTIKLQIAGKYTPLTNVFQTIFYAGTGFIECHVIKPEYISKPIQLWRYLKGNETTQTEPQLKTFPLENIDKMRDLILEHPKTSPFIINETTIEPYGNSLPTSPQEYSPLLCSQEGLAIKTYQSDLLNNWMDTEWLDGSNGINEITRVDTSSGSFKIDALILAKKVYNMLNAIAISGGTYNDWVEQVYDHEPFKNVTTPIYEGGLIKDIVFEEVISNSQAISSEGTQPLGTLAGKGRLGNKHKGGHIEVKADTHSYCMGIISITPLVDYSQGNKWDIHLKTMDDFHKPHLDQIGFQDVITEQMHWADTKFDYGNTDTWIQNSAGKQPAWMNYMTNLNEVRGNFAIEVGDDFGGTGGQMYMVFNRKYEMDPTTEKIKDLTTYIDPVKFNQIFAQTARDSQNFWVQVSVDITARRKMSSKIMPNL